MASGVDPMARYAVLGVLGVFAWQWASTQPAGSAARKTLDSLRGAFNPTAAHAAAASSPSSSGGGGSSNPAAPAPPPASQQAAPANPAVAPVPPAPDVTLTEQYNEQHSDGWYQVNHWSDDSYTFAFIDPSLWTAYGIDGAPVYGPPGTGTHYTAVADSGGPVYGPPAIAWGPIVQRHESDGQWWVDTAWTDGTQLSALIDPSQYSEWGLMPDGSGFDIYRPIPGAPINAVLDAAGNLIPSGPGPNDSRIEGAPINALLDWVYGVGKAMHG